MLLPVLIYLIPRLGSVTGFGCGGVTEEGRGTELHKLLRVCLTPRLF